MKRPRARAEILWGGVDQGFSSATNLGLSILAGRYLGAAGLGLIFLGFSAYLLALNFVRGFILDPFVVVTAALDKADREEATRACMTLVFCVALAISGLMVVLGLIVPNPLGKSLLIFAPWLAVLLIQDQWRSVLFRDQRGAAAACNDGMWALGMLVLLPIAWAHPSEWTVAVVWGGGAAFAAVLGAFQIRLRPSGLAAAVQWWKLEIRRLGWWLGAENLMTAGGAQVIVIVLAAVLTASDLGGIRVTQVVFAPMTLVGEAFYYPGVPIMARALAVSTAEARRWALRLGLCALALVGLYLGVVIPLGHQILTRVFGHQFTRFFNLVVPVALSQLFAGAALGFAILLRADRRVHAIVFGRLVNTIISLGCGLLFAIWWGVLGAVWGMVSGSLVGWTIVIVCGFLEHDIPNPFRPQRDEMEDVRAMSSETSV